MSLTVKKMKNQELSETASKQLSKFDELAHAYDKNVHTGEFKQQPEDFIVDEVLPFELR